MTKNVLTVFLIIVGLFLAFKLGDFLMTRDANAFCSQLGDDESTESIRLKAELRGYRVFERSRSGGEVDFVIPTQDSPFFRFACVATFEQGVLVHKEVIADD